MRIMLIIVGTLILLILCIMGYYGFFIKIKPEKAFVGGEYIAYREVLGAYSQSGPVSDEVYYTLLNDLKVETYRGFAIYFDNPQKVNAEELRSEVGCIIEENDLDKLDSIQEVMHIRQLEQKEYITAEFLYRGPVSSFISIFKVYPVLRKHARKIKEDSDGSIMEIWDVPNKKIIYRMSI